MSAPDRNDLETRLRPDFRTTHWSVVLAVGGGTSPAAQAALEQLCRCYWYPIYAFVRREGYATEEAQDLTQAFFTRLIERRDIEKVRQEKGRFRSYLLVAAKHFLVNDWHRQKAEKRGGNRGFIPLDEILAEKRYSLEPADTLSADRIFEKRWAMTLLEQVLRRLGEEYAAAGNASLFQSLSQLLSDEPGRPSQAELARALEMTENALKQAFHRMRRRYRELLREEISQTVATPGDIEDELRHLIAVLRA